uniref:Uncharacterized protein n=1 Tax=Fusarium oxysporum (strain Fo5176) TaxID=660025 RepID=A0A0D2XSX0_FUSOF
MAGLYKKTAYYKTDNWNEDDPQKCYHFNDITYNSVVLPWIWIAGLGIYQAALIWSFVDRKALGGRRDENGVWTSVTVSPSSPDSSKYLRHLERKYQNLDMHCNTIQYKSITPGRPTPNGL